MVWIVALLWLAALAAGGLLTFAGLSWLNVSKQAGAMQFRDAARFTGMGLLTAVIAVAGLLAAYFGG
jgi:hypothetical protein